MSPETTESTEAAACIEYCSEKAKLSPKVDIENRKKHNNEEENRYDYEG